MSEPWLILMEFSSILRRKKMVEVMRSKGTGERVRECEREVFVLCEKEKKRE